MISQTDRDSIRKLRNLREYKMNKEIVSIKKAKMVLNKTIDKKGQLKKELHSFHSARLTKHEERFDNLKKIGYVTIHLLMKHKTNNLQLIFEEKELIEKINLIEKLENNNKKDVEKHKKSMHALNKKIESLKVLELSFLKNSASNTKN